MSQFGLFSQFGGDCLVAALAVSHAGYKSLAFFSGLVEHFHHLNVHYDGTFNVLSNFTYAAIMTPLIPQR